MAIREKVDRLEEALIELAKSQERVDRAIERMSIKVEQTSEEVNRLSKEMDKFKEWSKRQIEELRRGIEENRKSMEEFRKSMEKFRKGMEEYREWSKKQIEELRNMTKRMNKQWGELANKLGTLVEDIFAPSVDIAIQNYFKCIPDVIDVRKLVRKDERSLEIDILALCRKEKRAFIFEVKSNPDRVEYIEWFKEKLRAIDEFLPELEGYEKVGIYGGLMIREETVKRLTKEGIYAMEMRGDILEIVNVEEVKGRIT